MQEFGFDPFSFNNSNLRISLTSFLSTSPWAYWNAALSTQTQATNGTGSAPGIGDPVRS